MKNPVPAVTIAIPTYNEAAHIGRVLDEFLHTSYQHVLEVLVVDGGSCDGTQDIVRQVAANDPRIRLLHNPHRVQAAGLNLALAEAQGVVFLRADAHCTYAPDYVERCVETLLHTGALNVGGAQRFIATNIFQSGVALASRSVLFSGGARYRNVDYEGPAETVFLGCFWKAILEAAGGYQSEMSLAEDNDLNLRLHLIHSRAVYISQAIKVWYYPRSHWYALVKQYVNYGKGACQTVQQHKALVQMRGMVPMLAASGCLVAIGCDKLLLQGKLHTYIFLLVILGVWGTEGLRITLKFRKTFLSEFWQNDTQCPPSLFWRWLWCSVVLATVPCAHAVGFALEFSRNKLVKQQNA